MDEDAQFTEAIGEGGLPDVLIYNQTSDEQQALGTDVPTPRVLP